MTPFVLGLGANTDQPQTHIDKAITALSTQGLLACSSIYTSKALLARGDNERQPDYINMVIAIESTLHPEQLLNRIHTIEYQHGRQRTGTWQPRPLDIDILLYSDIHYRSNRLTIPHLYMYQRSFVLMPLYEIQYQLPHHMQALCPQSKPVSSECKRTTGHRLTTNH